MALKFELEQWQQACTAFDNGDYDMSIKSFINIADSAKMHFNIGLIFATVDDHERALGAYSKAITMDPYFAVAYFQRGVSFFLQNNMDAAKNDFDQAYQKLRGNPIINYQQLGLNFRLYACEILFNRGICQLYLGKIDAGLTDLYHAQKAKMTEEHDVIDQAVKDRGKGYSVFSIPPLVIFRPPENRLKQLQSVDMFTAVDQLANIQPKNKTHHYSYTYHHISSQHINHKSLASIKRNNSVLVNNKLRIKSQVLPPPSTPLPPTPSSITTTNQLYNNSNASMNSMRSYNGNSPRQSSPLSPSSLPPTPTNSTPTMRKRKDSNLGMYNSDDSASTLSYASSTYRYPRRVDSGFESTVEDRYSSSSSMRSSAKTPRSSPPPVPPLPKDSVYGDFDQDLEQAYGSMSLQEKDLRLQPSLSNSSIGSNPSGKIKVKAHYSDTRILLVSTSISFNEFKARIIEKFDAPRSIRLQYKDEDNEMVLMIDDDDLYMARQVYKDASEFEKIEIWCV